MATSPRESKSFDSFAVREDGSGLLNETRSGSAVMKRSFSLDDNTRAKTKGIQEKVKESLRSEGASAENWWNNWIRDMSRENSMSSWKCGASGCGRRRVIVEAPSLDAASVDEFLANGDEQEAEALLIEKGNTKSKEGNTESARKDGLNRIEWDILLQYLVVLLYLAFGVMMYMAIEGWHMIPATYFVVVTLTTVGYGDMHPRTTLGMIFTMVYAALGIAVIFRVVIWLMSRVLDRHENFMLDVIADDGNLAEYRENQRKLRRKKWTRTMLFSGFIVLVYAMVGTLYWNLNFDLPIVKSLYLVVTTLTTIGYGDLSPRKLGYEGLAFSIIYVFTGVLIMTYIATKLTDIYIDYIHTEQHNKALKKKMTKHHIRKLIGNADFDTCLDNDASINRDGKRLGMSWGTFLSIMVLEMEIVDRALIYEIRERYEEMVKEQVRANLKNNLLNNDEGTSPRGIIASDEDDDVAHCI